MSAHTDFTVETQRSIEERTLVYFADNPTYLLEAYADSGEGIDRAGGFAIQVRHNHDNRPKRGLRRSTRDG